MYIYSSIFFYLKKIGGRLPTSGKKKKLYRHDECESKGNKLNLNCKLEKESE